MSSETQIKREVHEMIDDMRDGELAVVVFLAALLLFVRIISRPMTWLIAAVVAMVLLWPRPAHAQASVSVDIDLRGLIGRLQPRTPPKVTCGIDTVGYRFIGPAGRKLRYAGDTYQIEQDGDLELIADKRRRTYAVDGRSLPLDVWPKNAFGFREVPVK